MNIMGIIAEYNPFHNGHLYHLEKSKEITGSHYTIVVMSPNFVQRGAPALVDKWTRTKMALLSGADIVIELPTPYASSSAEFFAKSSVSLLHYTGIVNCISFGSESNNLPALHYIADILINEPINFKALLKKNLSLGLTFPKARANALIEYCQQDLNNTLDKQELNNIISTPNNILGIEYIKALKRLSSNLTPFTIQRTAPNYHDTSIDSNIASATAIRAHLQTGILSDIQNTLPPHAYHLLNEIGISSNTYVSYEDLSNYLCYRLLFSSPEDLQRIVGVTEGIENRILNAFQQTHSIENMISLVKSKRFTQTAIQRILLNIILQITKEDFNSFEAAGGPLYIRVLGFKKSSAHLISQMKQNASLPVIMNLGKDYQYLSPLAKKMIDFEIRSTNIYSSLKKPSDYLNLDFTTPLVIL